MNKLTFTVFAFLLCFLPGSAFAEDWAISKDTPAPAGAVLKEKYQKRPLEGFNYFPKPVEAYSKIYQLPGKTAEEALTFYRGIFGENNKDIRSTKFFTLGYLDYNGLKPGDKTGIYEGGQLYSESGLLSYGGDYGKRLKNCIVRLVPGKDDPVFQHVFSEGEKLDNGWKERSVMIIDSSYASVHGGGCEPSASVVVSEVVYKEK